MVYMKHTPAGTSTQNMIHWIQMTQTTKMQKFDYGSTTENEKHYGQVLQLSLHSIIFFRLLLPFTI